SPPGRACGADTSSCTWLRSETFPRNRGTRRRWRCPISAGFGRPPKGKPRMGSPEWEAPNGSLPFAVRLTQTLRAPRGAHLTTLTRWKLACALLAGIAGYATVSARGTAHSNTPAAMPAAPRGAALPQHLKRPLRISAEAAGLSRSELVERALSARNLRDLLAL